MLFLILVTGCALCFLVGYIHRAIMDALRKKARAEQIKRLRRSRRSLFTDLKQARNEAFGG